MGLLGERAREASICPSEVARRVRPEGWRAVMPHVRTAAARLISLGLVEATQGDNIVDVLQAGGPVRLRRSRK